MEDYILDDLESPNISSIQNIINQSEMKNNFK